MGDKVYIAGMPAEPVAPKRFRSEQLHEALIAAGLIRQGEFIRRIVIDAQCGEAVKMYVERFADTRLLDVVPTLDGIEVRGVSRG